MGRFVFFSRQASCRKWGERREGRRKKRRKKMEEEGERHFFH
jgi:hypothetical protein